MYVSMLLQGATHQLDSLAYRVSVGKSLTVMPFKRVYSLMVAFSQPLELISPILSLEENQRLIVPKNINQ